MNDKQKKYQEQIPDSYKLNYKKAVERKSRAAAVKAKCLDCCCWQRTEIVACQADTCPLWAYRPYQNAEGNSTPAKIDTLEKKTD